MRGDRLGYDGKPSRVRAAQLARLHEQIDLVLAPERVEVAGDDDRLARRHDEVVQVLQLRMPMTKLQRQVHEEDRALLELELDDEALDALVEVVKPLAVNARRGEKRVALLAENRQTVVQRAGAVLALVDGVVTRGRARSTSA